MAELGLELPEPPSLPFTPRLRPVAVHGGLAYLSGNGDVAARAAASAPTCRSTRRVEPRAPLRI
jgi:hypothetical protein